MSAFRIFMLMITFSALTVAPDAFAQKKRRPAAAASKAPSKPKAGLEQSKRFKAGKDKTEVDFDETSIEGQRKDPFGTLLNTREQDFNRGFIKLRYNWHDHMNINAMGMSQ